MELRDAPLSRYCRSLSDDLLYWNSRLNYLFRTLPLGNCTCSMRARLAIEIESCNSGLFQDSLIVRTTAPLSLGKPASLLGAGCATIYMTLPSPFPDKFHSTVDLIANGFGLSNTAATLLIANAVATAIGNSIQIRTIEYRDQPLGLNLAFVTNGGALVRSAFLGLLEPVCRRVDDACAARRLQGIQSTQADFEAFIAERNQVEAGIMASEAELRALDEYFDDVAAAVEKEIPPPMHPDYGFQTALRRSQLVGGIEFGRQRLVDLTPLIESRSLGLGPLVIADDCPWQELAGAGVQSFDGYVSHLNFAPHRFASLMGMSRRDVGSISELYRQTAVGSSSVSIGNEISPAIVGTWAGDEHAVASLLRSKSIAASGLMTQFLYCDADRNGVDPDPDAILEFRDHDVWPKFIDSVFRVRLALSRRTMLLDAGSFLESLTFRKWCRGWSSELPIGVKPYFENWPDLALRLALIIAIMDGKADGEALATSYVATAANWLKGYAESHVELLNRLIDAESPESALDRGVERILLRLRNRSPRTLRDIARTFDDQNYDLIGYWIEEAVRRGLVEKRDSYFVASNVGVSASVRPQEGIPA